MSKVMCAPVGHPGFVSAFSLRQNKCNTFDLTLEMYP